MEGTFNFRFCQQQQQRNYLLPLNSPKSRLKEVSDYRFFSSSQYFFNCPTNVQLYSHKRKNVPLCSAKISQPIDMILLFIKCLVVFILTNNIYNIRNISHFYRFYTFTKTNKSQFQALRTQILILQ